MQIYAVCWLRPASAALSLARACNRTPAIMIMRCVMRHARTPKFQFSVPAVHFPYCVKAMLLLINMNFHCPCFYRLHSRLLKTFALYTHSGCLITHFRSCKGKHISFYLHSRDQILAVSLVTSIIEPYFYFISQLNSRLCMIMKKSNFNPYRVSGCSNQLFFFFASLSSQSRRLKDAWAPIYEHPQRYEKLICCHLHCLHQL